MERGRAAAAEAAAEAVAEAGIVKPIRNAKTPTLAPRVLMAATPVDLDFLARQTQAHAAGSRKLYTSRLIHTASARGELTIVGPLMGAPYAVMLLETLVAWGACEFLFVGWCGALTHEIAIGDLLWASEAHIDEGSSPAYGQQWQGRVPPSGEGLGQRAAAQLEAQGLQLRRGPVWTTDAIFRETPTKVAHFQKKGALAVEMEVSALYSAAAFHGVSILALLTVSDSLADDVWRPGFRNDDFKRNRQRLCEAALKICLEKDP